LDIYYKLRKVHEELRYNIRYKQLDRIIDEIKNKKIEVEYNCDENNCSILINKKTKEILADEFYEFNYMSSKGIVLTDFYNSIYKGSKTKIYNVRSLYPSNFHIQYMDTDSALLNEEDESDGKYEFSTDEDEY